MDPTRKRLTLASLLLSGACRQSKIINTPNFEKWFKKFPLPQPTSPSHNTLQLRLIKINTSIKCEYAKPGGGRRANALMVFQTTRSIINIWRLGKCIRSLPPCTPFPLVTRCAGCEQKQCQDDALFPFYAAQPALGAGESQRFGSLRHCLQHRNNAVSCICIPE